MKSIINVLLALIKNEDPKALMKQFLGDLTNHKDLVAQKKIIIAATEGLSDIKDPK